MTTALGPYLKAIVAGTLAGLGTLYAAQADGVITGQEWTQVAIYTISAAAAIYGVPNTPAPAKQDNPPQQQAPASPYLPPAPATQWPAAAIGSASALPAPPAGYPEPGTTPADTAALAASAAARQGAQA